MSAMKVIEMVLLFAVCYECVPLNFEEVKSENAEEYPVECQNIIGKDDLDTYHKRQDCEIVFRNEYIKWSEMMLADEDFVKNLEEKNITEYQGIDNEEEKADGSRIKRSVRQNECPQFTEEYLRNNKAFKQRSLSPWEFFINHDENRKPQRLVDTRCLCKGCIDIATGVEARGDLVSVPLPLTVPVSKNGKLATLNVHLGCTCMVAITENSTP